MRPLVPTACALLAAALSAPRPASGAPAGDGGTEVTARLPGELSPLSARVAVVAGTVVLSAGARRQAGVVVGVGSLDAIDVTLTLKNDLGVAARAVELELVIGREVPDGLLDPRAGAERRRDRSPTLRGADGERRHASLGTPIEPIPGWRFRLGADLLAPTGTTPVTARFPLPPLEEASRPGSLAELGFSVRVVSYRVPKLPLATALKVLTAGTPADARSVFSGYGEEVRGEARRFDEEVLLGMLGAQPSREGRTLSQLAVGAGPAGTGARTPLELSFLLRACRRIGGQPTLEGLILHEARLDRSAPALPERLDEAHPPENLDLLPASGFAAALHETIVDVAHHNLAGLYLLLHAPPPAPPEALVEAARQLAGAEGLDAPDAWLEAALALSRDVPQFDPDTDREGRLPLLSTLARYGGPEVLPVLGRALEAEDIDVRDEAARALARRGGPAIAQLVAALDTEDAARRAPIASALGALEGEAREELARLVGERGVAVETGAGAESLVASLMAALREARLREVDERLARAEELAARSGADPAIPALLDEARRRSPGAYTEARERVGRVAARVYAARAAAGDPTARAILDEAGRLGPIAGSEYQAALGAARIAEARALAPRDLEGALRLLGPFAAEGAAGAGLAEGTADGAAGEAARRAAAGEIVLLALDGALGRGDRHGAERLLARARALAVPAASLATREASLESLRRRPLLLAAAGSAGLLLLAAGGLVLARRRRRRRETPGAAIA